MSAKHGEKPWEIEYNNDTGPEDGYFVEWFQVGPARIYFFRGEEEKARAIANRIRAAVNAVAGIPVSALEAGIVGEILDTLTRAADLILEIADSINDAVNDGSPIYGSKTVDPLMEAHGDMLGVIEKAKVESP